MKWCPKCEVDITETYQPAEPDVGIMNGGWFCDDCDLFVEEEDWPDDEIRDAAARRSEGK